LGPLKNKDTRGNGKEFGNLGGLNQQWVVKLIAVEFYLANQSLEPHEM
jgi:hypothetical protein